MPSREEISEIYDNFLYTLDENFVLNGFIFGFSFSMILLLITTQFIKKIPIIVIILFSLFTSLFFGFFQQDLTQILNFLDIPFSIIASFLFIRLCMSLSRITMSSDSDETTQRSIIISISFISISFTIFILYYTYEKAKLVFCVYVLNLLVLILTYALENGIISDACLVIAYSILFISKSEELSTLISVIRFLLLVLSLLSLLKKSPIAHQESIFSIFSLKKNRTRIMLMLAVSTYFYISPGFMWEHGYNKCIFQSITTPILYLLLLTYEYYQTDDPSYSGYSWN